MGDQHQPAIGVALGLNNHQPNGLGRWGTGNEPEDDANQLLVLSPRAVCDMASPACPPSSGVAHADDVPIGWHKHQGLQINRRRGSRQSAQHAADGVDRL